MSLSERLKRVVGKEKHVENSSSIKERLEQIVDERLEKLQNSKRAIKTSIEEALLGEIINNKKGQSLFVKRSYSIDYCHGNTYLSAAFDVKDHEISIMTRNNSMNGIEISDLVFVDTETTGLSGGAGTCAFLIGAGFFINGLFHINQFFMRDFNEEHSMLLEFEKILEGKKGFVSFNGKAFDIPLIEERFILKRKRVDLRSFPHLDLLYPSRRLWKGLYNNCRLVTLEEMVLGAGPRVDDVDSFLIPSYYFEYLRTGRIAMIERIFSHNRMDIITMAALMARIASLINNPFQEEGRNLEKLGRFHKESGNSSLGCKCIETAIDSGLYGNDRLNAMKYLSFQYKKEGRIKEAVHLWEIINGSETEFDPVSALELAKYYEHREKMPEKAMEIVIRLIREIPENDIKLRNQLEYRQKRLAGKIMK